MLSISSGDRRKWPPNLPQGYHIRHDPDTPALVRDDGSVVAVFSAHGAMPCEIRRAAQRDLERSYVQTTNRRKG